MEKPPTVTQEYQEIFRVFPIRKLSAKLKELYEDCIVAYMAASDKPFARKSKQCHPKGKGNTGLRKLKVELPVHGSN